MLLFSNNREVWLRRAEAFSDSRSGVVVLASIAFADSSVLPVVPDLLLIPMLLLRPDRTFSLTATCVVASSIGALVGYGIGHIAWASLGETLVKMYGQADNIQRYQRLVEDWGLWIIIAKSFTPIPFKFIAIAAGVASMNLLTFTAATVIGRALHFAILALLVASWGQQFLQLVAKYERWLLGFGIIGAISLGIAYATR
ncbi:YqaA family protein [Bradyrhizobium sp.]|uniref:YqaA family protein n=1 Tax=Bradyrhizobium sp. TaxID=376 RepID=UPI0025C0F7C0|nr:VTT domain-containing protein [Bradyrhizobium sp.]MBV8917835.1 DedA family protein [Bradyrhizobium sp.]